MQALRVYTDLIASTALVTVLLSLLDIVLWSISPKFWYAFPLQVLQFVSYISFTSLLVGIDRKSRRIRIARRRIQYIGRGMRDGLIAQLVVVLGLVFSQIYHLFSSLWFLLGVNSHAAESAALLRLLQVYLAVVYLVAARHTATLIGEVGFFFHETVGLQTRIHRDTW